VISSSPPGPVTVANASTFTGNVAVQYASGAFLTQVVSAPTLGQYAVTAGVYTFSTADEGATVLISYSFTNASTAQSLTVSLTIPGFQGNNVTLALTLTPGSGKSDALSISGAGTDAISLELLKADNITVRTLANVNTLISAGIPTALGYLTGILTGSGVNQALAQTATAFTGGKGPNTNTVFQTHFAPIVDGTNGGVVTTNPASVVVLVNGVAVTVSVVDGQSGQVTLANPVSSGSTMTITYYTNHYQHTDDLLPAEQVASIVQVGLGPNRADYIQGIDYVLTQDGTMIAWGANTDIAAGTSNSNSVAQFGPIQITSTLVDEHIYLSPCTGSVNGINANFTLANVPVDGSGLARSTDNPSLIWVYVGPSPIAALAAGAVVVAALDGAAAQITLFNPPTSGNNVYASYYRSTLNDHTYTLTVQTPGIPGQGTYSATNELNQIVPVPTIGTNHVADGNFNTTGIIWPYNFPDFEIPANSKTEAITLTFQDDDLHFIVTPAVGATVAVAIGATATFTATEVGSLEPDWSAPNGTSSVTVVNNAAEPVLVANQVYASTGTIYNGTTTAFPIWTANTLYSLGQIIYDSGTASIQVVTTAGTSNATRTASFSATAGVTAREGGSPSSSLIWTSNGLAPATAEQIVVNIWSTTGGQSTVNALVALFSGSNKVTTPKAGVVTAAVTSGTGTSLATPIAISYFEGGVNPTTIDYSDRFLVTSTIAGGKGTGEATTPATPNVDASGPWSAATVFAEGQIISFVYSGTSYLAQAGQYGESGASTPFVAGSIVTGATTTDHEITWTTLGPVLAPVGTNGYLGQSYVDTNTGVKFTIVDPNNALPYGWTTLPSPSYHYRPGDTLQLIVNANPVGSSLNQALFTTGAIPTIEFLGTHTNVVTTYGMTTGDTATVMTFNGNDGNEPNVGEYYYITFTINKTPQDMALVLYTDPTLAYAAYGTPNTINRASLAVQLMTANGAQQFGVVQVPVQPNLNTGSDSSYESAIQSLAAPLPGTQNHVNVIVPLSTSAPVQQFLSRFLITQAAPRQKAEAIAFIGTNIYATPASVSALAQSLANSRVILVVPGALPGGYGIQITNTQTGVAQEYCVDGTFAAAAMAGLNVNPANDVATTLTFQDIVGFTRLLGTRLDDPTMDGIASNGATVVIENNGGLLVRDYLSTDPSNILTSIPTVTTTTDYVAQYFRAQLAQFIGRKLIGSVLGSIQIVCNSLLSNLVNALILQGYAAPVVKQDASDPTTVDIAVAFQPVFSIRYIGVTFTVTSSSVSSTTTTSTPTAT
jgi:hypothetical protein